MRNDLLCDARSSYVLYMYNSGDYMITGGP